MSTESEVLDQSTAEETEFLNFRSKPIVATKQTDSSRAEELIRFFN